jgi:hypothetical protein
MSVPTLDNSPTAANAAHTGFAAGLTDAVHGGIISTTSTNPTVITSGPGSPQGSNPRFTVEDIENARKQEKEKLYPQIEELKGRLQVVEQERQARIEAEKQAKEKAENKAKKKAEEETDLRTLLEQKEADWQARLEQERQQREQFQTLLEREREFQALEQYRSETLNANRDSILPELVDLVTGNTREEIDASIAGLKDRSSRILEATQAAMQATRQNWAGTRVTAPPAGPLDTDSGSRQFSAEDIRNMPVSEYAKVRGKLLGNSSANRNRGLFG